MKEKLPEGYEIPVHRSLVKPLVWAGVPRDLFLANVFLGILGGVIFKTFLVVVVVVVLHYLFKYLASSDPQFHTVFWRAKSHKTIYYR